MSKPSQGIATKPATTPTTTAKPTTTSTATANTPQFRALTEKLAYELWEKRGRKPGSDVQDWLEAEKMARQKLGT